MQVPTQPNATNRLRSFALDADLKPPTNTSLPFLGSSRNDKGNLFSNIKRGNNS